MKIFEIKNNFLKFKINFLKFGIFSWKIGTKNFYYPKGELSNRFIGEIKDKKPVRISVFNYIKRGGYYLKFPLD